MEACKVFFFFALVTLAVAQRPFYAGMRPIGYPETAPAAVDLSNRFGEDANYPLEARGDRNLINRIENMPIDSRPFWYLNSKQYDDLRKNPVNYPQRPNSFIGTRR